MSGTILKDKLKLFATAALCATVILTFGIQAAGVHGQSMAPTLSDGDRLIVNKFVYRMGEPHRGDIVMFHYPPKPDTLFVKRVIAKEGDRGTHRRWSRVPQ